MVKLSDSIQPRLFTGVLFGGDRQLAGGLSGRLVLSGVPWDIPTLNITIVLTEPFP